jgi:8-oxo-dGTP pyrophosphatase MutT (NUDIX family)
LCTATGQLRQAWPPDCTAEKRGERREAKTFLVEPVPTMSVRQVNFGHLSQTGLNMSEQVRTEPIDAATVVVARDTHGGIEVLMLRKSSKVYFGGMWVFPGGMLDPEDQDGAHVEGTGGDGIAVFRRAAVREAREEAGIDLSGCTLSHLSHWMPPPIRPVRFSTHFFLTTAPPDLGEIQVDGGEITEHEWLSPRAALKRRHQGKIELVTPTFVTLDWLRRFDKTSEAVASISEAVSYHTHIVKTERGSIAFYPGDVAYDTLSPEAPGPRRRVNMLDTGWWWEEHDGEGNGPWPTPIDC